MLFRFTRRPADPDLDTGKSIRPDKRKNRRDSFVPSIPSLRLNPKPTQLQVKIIMDHHKLGGILPITGQQGEDGIPAVVHEGLWFCKDGLARPDLSTAYDRPGGTLTDGDSKGMGYPINGLKTDIMSRSLIL